MGRGLVTLYFIDLPAWIYVIMGWDTIWYVMGQVSGQGPIKDVSSTHDSQFLDALFTTFWLRAYHTRVWYGGHKVMRVAATPALSDP